MPGVIQAIPVSRPYKLVSREMKREDTVIPLPGVDLGRGHFVVIAGPCAVESETQALTIAYRVKAAGARIFLGRRLQAPHFPLQLPGHGKSRPEDPQKGAGGDRPAHRHRSGGPGVPEAGGRICRHHPDRGPEYAKLQPAALRRPDPETGDAEKRHVRHPGWLRFMAAEYIMSEGRFPGDSL